MAETTSRKTYQQTNSLMSSTPLPMSDRRAVRCKSIIIIIIILIILFHSLLLLKTSQLSNRSLVRHRQSIPSLPPLSLLPLLICLLQALSLRLLVRHRHQPLRLPKTTLPPQEDPPPPQNPPLNRRMDLLFQLCQPSIYPYRPLHIRQIRCPTRQRPRARWAGCRLGISQRRC